MQIALVIVLSLHVLSSVFWAGSSFTLARTGGAGGELLFGEIGGAVRCRVFRRAFVGRMQHLADQQALPPRPC